MLQWLHDLSFSGSVRENFYIFPALECIHIYSMIFLITLVGAFDLRLMGLKLSIRGNQPVASMAAFVLRWAWISLLINFMTGAILFMSKAPDYYTNIAFRYKMAIILTGVIYHSLLLPAVAKRDDAHLRSVGMKLAGTFSLMLWISVIAASRWIAFV